MRKWFLKVLQMNIAKCYALLLVVLALLSVNGVDVYAAEAPTIRVYGVFESDGVNVPYYYTDVVNRINYKYQNNDVYVRFSHPVYVAYGKQPDGNLCLYFLSDSIPEGDFVYGDNILFESISWNEGNSGGYKYYYCNYTFKKRDHDLNYADVPSLDGMRSNFLYYYLSDDFDDLITEPIDFNNYNKCDWLWLEDFRAELKDSNIYMTWGDLAGYMLTDQNTYKNRYIEFSALFVNDDTDNISDKYFMPDLIYTDLADYEGNISYDDWKVPEGSRLLYLYATPYWFYMDIPDGKISRGKMSMITFNSDGTSGNPLIKDTDDIYNPIDPDFSNWNAITNFTGNYFNNMQQTFENTFQNYDTSGMDDNTEKLGGGLRRYQGEQDAIIDGVSANIEQFNPGDYLNFSEQIVYAMGMASGWINQFLNVSADFTTVFIVGCIMVVIFVVIGIWRFQ